MFRMPASARRTRRAFGGQPSRWLSGYIGITSPRTTMVAQPPTSWMAAGWIGMISRTMDSGTANGCSPSCTSNTGRIASVSGSEMTKVEPLPGTRFDVDAAVELLDVGLDHVHADTAAGNIRGHILGRKARQQDEIEALPVIHRIGFFIGDQAFFERLGTQRSAFMPRPSSALIRMTMWSPSWRASRRTWDFSGLPAARRSSDDSTP
jgi:hypothetical protein